MRTRLALIAATAAAVVAALPAHAANVKTLDGAKTKSLSFTDKITAPQDNDADFVGLGASDRTRCSEPRCSKFSFKFAPAHGVKNHTFSVRISWTYPVEDYDLYVVQDNGGTVGQCGAGAGTSETAIVTGLPGHTYTVVVDHYRALPDTVSVQVQFPTTQKIASVAPAAVEKNVEPVNCGIS